MDPDKVEKILGISEQQAAAYVDKDDTATDTLGKFSPSYFLFFFILLRQSINIHSLCHQINKRYYVIVLVIYYFLAHNFMYDVF